MGIKLAYFCSSNSWGGLEMNHLRNAVWMSERGHAVLILGLKDSPIHQKATELELPFLSVEAHRRWYDFKAVTRAQEILESEKVSHFIVRKPGDMSLAAGLKYRLKDQLHVSYFMEMQLGIKKKSIFHTIRYRYIDVWSCPLNWLKKQVENQTHFRNDLVVIPSGIRLDEFKNPPSKDISRHELNLPKDRIILGMAGRFDPKKGQLVLLETMQKSKHSNFSLLFMGETTQNEGSAYEKSLFQFIEENGLKDRVIFRPYGSNISHFYRSIDWMVMASESETVGMVTIESLASETPVLGSNAGGTPEIMNSSEGGILFESMNSDDLAAKIDEIMASTPKRNPEKLRALVGQNDHREVCAKVEAALGLEVRH
ncbi:MAG: glycosyltransferase family 4 protein [Crocinitomicaceae bacterium]|nr:glycosyltransferase family 4 protein [Crocinitomicaceae bacterium]